MFPIPRSAVIAASLALVLTACGGNEQAQGGMPPPEVGVVTVQPAAVPVQKDLVGRFAPKPPRVRTVVWRSM